MDDLGNLEDPRDVAMDMIRRSLVTIVLLLIAGCGGSGAVTAPAPPKQLAQFGGGGLAFSYPAAWRQASYPADASSFSALVTYLSSQPLADPCVRDRTGIKCDSSWGVGHLDPGGILVSWTERSFPYPNGQDLLSTFQGKRTTVAGHAAKLSIKRGAAAAFCPQIGGQESMILDVLRDVSDNWFEMIACMRAPGLDALEVQVRSMLASTKFTAK